MIYILHPTVFSLADSFKSLSCRRSLSLLKFLAELFVLGTLLLDVSATNKTGLVFAVIGCNNKVDSSVYANNIANV